jgi:hypothetical protein
LRMDLNRALSVHESGNISGKSLIGPIVHMTSMTHWCPNYLYSMAVPCMRFLGERIMAVEAAHQNPGYSERSVEFRSLFS